MKKRVLSLFMALALCLSMTPEVSYAEEAGAVTEQEAQSGESTADVYIAGSNDDSDSTGSDTTGGETTGSDSTDSGTTSNVSGGDASSVSGNNVSGGDASGQDAEKDAAVQAVQALIDALPDEVTDELEAQLIAIGEALTALNDEQLAKLDMTRYEAICAALITYVAVQDGGHDHAKMQAWKKDNALPEGTGSYYLDTDVKLTETWKPANDTVLCLNGHSITMNTNGIDVITIGSGVTFTLYDCNDSNNGKGIITHAASTTSLTGCGVKVTGGTFNMYGGTISDNKVTEHGGGVYVANSYSSVKGTVSGTFNMYGGTISGNKASADNGRGGGVYVCNSKFNMTDGEITGNTAYYGGGVGLTDNAVFCMTGGTIKANNLNNRDSAFGGGVWVDNGCSFTVSGDATVSGNMDYYSSNGNNVELASGQTITIAGKLTGSIGVYTYDTPVLTKPVTIAKAADGYDGLSEDVAHITSDSDKGYCPFFVDGVVKLYATQPKVHPICGKTCEHEGQHDDVIWEGISELRDITKSGNYYLTDSVELDATWTCSSDVKLCLNGKSITQTTTNQSVIKIAAGGKLTLTDCKGDNTEYGKITHTSSSIEGRGVEVYGGTFTMYGGSITGNCYYDIDLGGGGVWVLGGTFKMYDGSITQNKAYLGGGVFVGNGSSKEKYGEAAFEMYGGEISNNTAAYNSYGRSWGGGVYVDLYYNEDGTKSPANFTMYDGTISENYASDRGGGVYVWGTFTMQKGSISENTAQYYGSGVYLAYDDTYNGAFIMQGGSISKNYIRINPLYPENYDGGVYANGTSTITVSGTARITDNYIYDGVNKKISGPSGNVIMGTGKFITIGEGGLAAGAKIGVKLRTAIEEGKTVDVAQGSEGYVPTEKDRAAFVSDDDTYKTRLKNNKVVFANGDPHVHSICATTDCTHKGIHDGHDENQEWNSIASLDEIQTGGYYYLKDNVTLDKAWTCDVEGDVYLCLNGKTITGAAGKTVIIVDSDASLNITDCNETVGKITHASGKYGAGIDAKGTLTLWNGAIDGNSGYTYGSVCVEQGGKFTMHGGSITNNTGKLGGGVCILNVSTFEMTGGDITGNSSTDSYGGGGVKVGSQGTFTMTGGSIAKNTGKYTSGGGVFVSYNSTFNMDGGDITGNTGSSTYGGGGVFVEYGGTFKMTAGVITDNNGKGGGVYVSTVDSTDAIPGKFIMTGGSITGNKNKSSDGGGGVYLNGGKFTMEGGSITNNTGFSGSVGGVYLDSGTFDMKSGTISDNDMSEISSSNGGVHVGSNVDSTTTSTARFTMSGGSITGNKGKNGGGVYVGETGKFEMSDGDITGNTSSSSGGGVYVATGGKFTMSKESTGKIAENTSQNRGGGVYIYGTFEMNGGEITGNTSSSYGGGVYVASGGEFTMSKDSTGKIAKNTGSSGGGVCVYENSTFTMDGGSITGNKCKDYGGGVYVYNKSTFTMDGDSKITGNTSDYGGGGVFLNDSTFKMDGGRITGNKADSYAGGVDVTSGSTFTMSKGSITGNTSVYGGGVYVDANQSTTFTVSGAVKIKDNWMNGVLDDKGLYVQGENGTKNNVCLATGTTNLATITINGLTAGAEIGVSKKEAADLPTLGQPVKIATGASDNSLTYFTSDVAEKGYVVTKKGTELYLEEHQHSWTYTASGATITAKCSDTATCPNPDGGSVIIIKPEHVTYGDNLNANATLDDSAWKAETLNSSNIIYKDEKGNPLGQAPTNAGEYTASITMGDATASVEYEIAKAKPTEDDFNFTPAGTLIYDGTPKLAKVVAKDIISGMGEVTVKYYRNGTPVEEPIDAGAYTVEVSVAEGDNYNSVSFLDNDWEFTIAKRDVEPKVKLNGNMIYTGRQIEPNVTVTVGNTVLDQGTDYIVDYGTNIDAGENAGTVIVKAKAGGNYAFEDVTTKFDIERAPQYLQFELNHVEKTYGEAAFSNLVTGAVEGSEVTYSSDKEDVAKVNKKTGEVTIVGAGSAVITAATEGTQNYGANSETYTLTVKAAKIQIVGAKVDDKDYDGSTKAEVTSVTFADENNKELKLKLGDYTAIGKFLDVNAGKDKDVEVTVRLENSNYELIDGDEYKTTMTTATINKKPISIGKAVAVDRDYVKDKTSVEISVTFNGATLIEGTDYDVTGKMGDDNAGTKDVAVEVTLINKAAENYVLSDNKTTTQVTINQVTPEITAASEQTIVKNGVAMDISGWATTNNTDDTALTYTLVGMPTGIELKDNKLTAANAASTVSSFEIRVTGAATTNFTAPGEQIITVKVEDKADAGVSITGAPTGKTYGDGNFTLKAEKTAPDGGAWNWSSTDSDVLEIVSGADTATPTIQVKKVGSAMLKVTYTSDTHYGSANVTIKVVEKNVTADMIAAIPAQEYTGSAIEPTPDVKDGTTKLLSGTDFDYSYSNNFNAGTATLTITGKGNYTGTADKTFTISTKSINGAVIALDAESFAYNGSEQTVTIASVKLSDGTVLSENDYVIKDNSNKEAKAGEITLTIEGTGNYTGTATTTWQITKIDPTLDDFMVSDLATALTYNGEEKTVTVNKKDGIDGMGSFTVKYNGSTEEPINAGDYVVTIEVSDGNNYNATTITAGTLTIDKAAAPTLEEIKVGYKYTLTGEKEIKLAGLVKDATGYKLGAVTGDTDIISDYSDPIGTDGVLKFKLTGTGKIGNTVTLPVTITSVNHEDALVNVIITMEERTKQADLSITADNTVVYDKTLKLGTTGGSGTGDVTYSIVDDENSTGEATIEGNLLTPKKVGKITVIATKAGDVDYNEASSEGFVITITKASVTGEPGYTEITTGGRTLADAGLTTGGLNPAEGTLEWIDDAGNVLNAEETTVEVNTEYTWRFTPANDNYDILTGEIELYHVDMPVISSQPKDLSVKAGEYAAFEVTATGTDLTYQWQIDRNDGRGFVNLNNATGASYTSAGVTDRDCDGFKYQCIISNAAGSVTTETAILTVTVYYTITATAGEHGSISPSGDVEAAEGSNQTFTITADDGYEIESLKVDGAAVETAASYSFTDVKETHTIEVTFKHGPYRIIDGADSSWTQNVDGSLVIRGNGEFADFLKVLVDGKEIAPENYTATEGSTIITLKPEFLSTLSEGSHTFEIVWRDGSADTHFTVARNASGNNNNNNNSNNNSSNDNAGSDNTEDKTVIAPKTGDASRDALLAVLVVVSFAGLAGMLVLKRRNAYK